MVGVKNKENIHRSFKTGIDVVFTDLPHHVEEVSGEGEIVIRIDEGESGGESISH